MINPFMDLVLDIGNFRIKGAFFEGDILKKRFSLPLTGESLKEQLQPVERCLISSVNDLALNEVKKVLEATSIPYQLIDFSKLKVALEVDEPDAVGHDRIANVYGALHRFPQNDCIVIDIGTAVTFDLIGKEGRYLGGAIYPGMEIGSKGLNLYTDKLPKVEAKRPPSVLGKTTETHIQSGLYWGLLGAIERIIAELRQTADYPGSVKVIATGGATRREEFIADLSDLVDLIDPELTLIGLHEILKEGVKNDQS